MASKRKGTVSKIGKSKFSYFIQLDGDGHYFNTKFNPKCGEGDVVGITFDRKNDQRSQIKDVKLLEDKGGPKGYQDSGGDFGGGGSSNKGGGFKAEPGRQDSIVYQSSRKDALVLAGIILSNDAIKLPKDADKRRTVIEALVDETTATYFAAASDPKSALKGETEVSKDADGGDDWSDDDADSFDDDWE
jgi:hypothetical protein